MKAIETRYKGYRFRSRLEARWAVFFDTLGVPWEYEKEGYDLGTYGWYLPDFFLPTVYMRGGGDCWHSTSQKTDNFGIWLEIKPVYPDGQEEKFKALGKLTGHPVAVAIGMPDEWNGGFSGEIFEMYPIWDNFMEWMRCQTCGAIKIEFSESNYKYCPKCGGAAGTDAQILLAVDAARSARFEHSKKRQHLGAKA